MSIQLTEQNFNQEVIESTLPVLVDFWAPWCGPCSMISSAIEEIAKDYEGKIKVGKLNIDDARSIAMQYQVMSIPTIAIFNKGEIADRIVGVVSKDKIEENINSII